MIRGGGYFLRRKLMQIEQRQKIPILQNQVVFSKNYLPLARINLKRAIVLLVTGQQRLWSLAALNNGKCALPASYYKSQITFV
jgi:hypothetical protein